MPGVLCSVYNQGTAVLASLYQDDAGTVPLSNPLTNDATYGSVKFYINPGHFDLSFTKPGYTFEPIYDFQVVEDLLTLGTMATQNANAVAITGGQIVGLGTLGIANSAPSYPLDVTGQARVLGAVGIAANPIGNFALALAYDKAAAHGIQVRPLVNDTGGGFAVYFVNVAGGGVGAITTSATATTYGTSSDGRLKHAVQALSNSLDVIAQLNPISHLWNADDSYGEGFLAHELQRVLAYAVQGEPDAVNDDGTIRPQQVDLSKCVPRLVGAVKELLAQVQALTARVATLEEALP